MTNPPTACRPVAPPGGCPGGRHRPARSPRRVRSAAGLGEWQPGVRRVDRSLAGARSQHSPERRQPEHSVIYRRERGPPRHRFGLTPCQGETTSLSRRETPGGTPVCWGSARSARSFRGAGHARTPGATFGRGCQGSLEPPSAQRPAPPEHIEIGSSIFPAWAFRSNWRPACGYVPRDVASAPESVLEQCACTSAVAGPGSRAGSGRSACTARAADVDAAEVGPGRPVRLLPPINVRSQPRINNGNLRI